MIKKKKKKGVLEKWGEQRMKMPKFKKSRKSKRLTIKLADL